MDRKAAVSQTLDILTRGTYQCGAKIVDISRPHQASVNCSTVDAIFRSGPQKGKVHCRFSAVDFAFFS